jgi:hypothetical protein
MSSTERPAILKMGYQLSEKERKENVIYKDIFVELEIHAQEYDGIFLWKLGGKERVVASIMEKQSRKLGGKQCVEDEIMEILEEKQSRKLGGKKRL